MHLIRNAGIILNSPNYNQIKPIAYWAALESGRRRRLVTRIVRGTAFSVPVAGVVFIYLGSSSSLSYVGLFTAQVQGECISFIDK